ncbi:MAG TPA: hypothetical protein VM491_12665 [Burkholderiaceae bacterium]|nr:hypothetical protein [Burkholderiaceae bacterium]
MKQSASRAGGNRGPTSGASVGYPDRAVPCDFPHPAGAPAPLSLRSMGIDPIVQDASADAEPLGAIETLPRCPECDNPLAINDVVCQRCDLILDGVSRVAE